MVDFKVVTVVIYKKWLWLKICKASYNKALSTSVTKLFLYSDYLFQDLGYASLHNIILLLGYEELRDPSIDAILSRCFFSLFYISCLQNNTIKNYNSKI